MCSFNYIQNIVKNSQFEKNTAHKPKFLQEIVKNWIYLNEFAQYLYTVWFYQRMVCPEFGENRAKIMDAIMSTNKYFTNNEY